MQQAGLESRCVGKGEGVVHRRITTGGPIVHYEETRPLRAVGGFFRRGGDHQERLPGPGRELRHDVAQQPAAAPGARVRPDNDEVTIFFRGGAQNHFGRPAPAHLHGIRHPCLLSHSSQHRPE